MNLYLSHQMADSAVYAAQDLHAAIELAMHNHTDTEEEQSTGKTHSLLINDSIFVKDELVYRRIHPLIRPTY